MTTMSTDNITHLLILLNLGCLIRITSARCNVLWLLGKSELHPDCLIEISSFYYQPFGTPPDMSP
jgi:hypothetical protein